MSALVQWLDANHTVLWWTTGASVVMFVATLIVIPVLVVRIPPDYFSGRRRQAPPWAHHHPLLRVALICVKNVLGVAFLLAGFAMLVLPGQGILTILIALMMLDVPGKYRFERWLVRQPAVSRSMAWLREKAGREPLIVDNGDAGP